MNWISVAVLIILSVIFTVFAISNSREGEMVIVHFAANETGPLPLFAPILIAFFIGFLGGMLALSFSRRKHKREIAALRQQNALLQKELDNLRTLPLQDET